MKRCLPASWLALSVLFAASIVLANPGDPRVVQGVVAWGPGGDGSAFVVVAGDDGRHYVADLSGAQWRGDPVRLGDRISVAGVEGTRPWQMAALVAGAGDAAIAGLPSPPIGAAGPNSTTTPPPPAERLSSGARAWRRIEGTVDSLTRTTVQLRGTDGRTVAVDVSRLNRGAAATLRRGDRAIVFVVAESDQRPTAGGDQRLIAVGFVRSEPAQPTASPRPPP